MKKLILGACTVLAAGALRADLSIDFFNNSVGVQDDAIGQNFVPAGSVVQLIWSATGAVDAPGSYAVDADAVRGESDGTGGYVLARQTTTGFGLWDSEPTVPVYTSTDIGGLLDINTGYFFARVFENIGALGESFMDIPMAAASSWVYNPGPPPVTSTIYSQNALPGEPESVIYIGAYATTVIPEPATICFMGLGLVGFRMQRFRKRFEG